MLTSMTLQSKDKIQAERMLTSSRVVGLLLFLSAGQPLTPVLGEPLGPPPCDGDATLERAARAYRDAVALVGVASYDIRVPGAPPHHETLDFGFGRGADLYLRMPQGYMVLVRAGRLFGFADERTDTYVMRPISGGLQATVDAAFEGIGPPLVPVPALLGAAATPGERIQAFALKLLASPAVANCDIVTGTDGKPVSEVVMRANNGSMKARFDNASGLLSELDLEVIPAPGQPPIEGMAHYDLVPGGQIPRFPEVAPGAAVVSRFSEFDQPKKALESPLSGEALVDLDGSSVRLDGQHDYVLVLEFWASWCAPCRLTLPVVEDFARWAHRSQLPVKVYLVNTLEGFQSVAEARQRLAPYLAQAQATLPILVDLDGSFHSRLGSGLPVTVLFDTAGRIAATYVGFEPGIAEKLRADVLTIVRRSVKPPPVRQDP
jgi:thiol-disulfide isomerase/thioredoxin